MSAKYYCDDCGTELISPYEITNGFRTMFNCDGYKYYDTQYNRYIDLCDDCKKKRYLKEVNPHGEEQ